MALYGADMVQETTSGQAAERMLLRARQVVPTDLEMEVQGPVHGLARDDQEMCALVDLCMSHVAQALGAPTAQVYVERATGLLRPYAAVKEAVYLLPIARLRADRVVRPFWESLLVRIEEEMGPDAAESAEQGHAMLRRAVRFMGRAQALDPAASPEDGNLARSVNGSMLIFAWSTDVLALALFEHMPVDASILVAAVTDLRVSARNAAVDAKDLLDLRSGPADAR